MTDRKKIKKNNKTLKTNFAVKNDLFQCLFYDRTKSYDKTRTLVIFSDTYVEKTNKFKFSLKINTNEINKILEIKFAFFIFSLCT